MSQGVNCTLRPPVPGQSSTVPPLASSKGSRYTTHICFNCSAGWALSICVKQASQYGSLPLIPRLVEEINTFKPTIAFQEGDISYARGAVTQWDTYFHQYEPVFSRVPVMMVPGNHERDWPASGDRFWPYSTTTVDSGGCPHKHITHCHKHALHAEQTKQGRCTHAQLVLHAVLLHSVLCCLPCN